MNTCDCTDYGMNTWTSSMNTCDCTDYGMNTWMSSMNTCDVIDEHLWLYRLLHEYINIIDEHSNVIDEHLWLYRPLHEYMNVIDEHLWRLRWTLVIVPATAWIHERHWWTLVTSSINTCDCILDPQNRLMGHDFKMVMQYRLINYCIWYMSIVDKHFWLFHPSKNCMTTFFIWAYQ